jgi:hypothetical protein
MPSVKTRHAETYGEVTSYTLGACAESRLSLSPLSLKRVLGHNHGDQVLLLTLGQLNLVTHLPEELRSCLIHRGHIPI